MSDDLELGPIDYVVVEWPKGSPPDGKAFPLLFDLVERGLIRILDMSFVEKAENGDVLRIDIADFDTESNPEFVAFGGASSDLLGQDDLDEAGNAMEPGTAGAILVYENTWAAPFATALRGAGAQMVASGRIPASDLLATLDEREAEEN